MFYQHKLQYLLVSIKRERERESNVQRNPDLLFSYMEHFSQSSSLCEYILSFHIHIYKKNETLEVICEKEYFCKSISNCVWCKVFPIILTNSGKFFHQRHTGVGPFHWNSRDEKDLNRKYQKQFPIRWWAPEWVHASHRGLVWWWWWKWNL